MPTQLQGEAVADVDAACALQLPQVIQPGQVLRSILFGDRSTHVKSYILQGAYCLSLDGRAEQSQALNLIYLLLPNYLEGTTPSVVLGDGASHPLQLVFLCRDRPPEILVLPHSWTEYVERLRNQVKMCLPITSDITTVNKSSNLADLLELTNKFDVIKRLDW